MGDSTAAIIHGGTYCACAGSGSAPRARAEAMAAHRPVPILVGGPDLAAVQHDQVALGDRALEVDPLAGICLRHLLEARDERGIRRSPFEKGGSQPHAVRGPGVRRPPAPRP
jgi:hypothetical protein